MVQIKPDSYHEKCNVSACHLPMRLLFPVWAIITDKLFAEASVVPEPDKNI